jgi:hypothetical protein
MKKLRTLMTTILLIGLFQLNTNAQDTIVQWTFPSANGTADGGIPANLDKFIETAGGTSEIEFKNGATTKAARATNWDNGANEKKWKVEFVTTNYTGIKLSSKVSAGGSNPGPRDFKVQYKAGNGNWTDVENSGFQTANDWTTGVLSELVLPTECENQSLLKIRWIMTSDTAVDGSIVSETGISKIDDIFITGTLFDGEEEIASKTQISIYPNPASDFIQIQNNSNIRIELFSLNGKQLINIQTKDNETIDVSHLVSGTYLLRIQNLETQMMTTKTILIQ